MKSHRTLPSQWLVFHFSFFIFHLACEAACDAKAGGDSGQNGDDRLDDELPSVLFHGIRFPPFFNLEPPPVLPQKGEEKEFIGSRVNSLVFRVPLKPPVSLGFR